MALVAALVTVTMFRGSSTRRRLRRTPRRRRPRPPRRRTASGADAPSGADTADAARRRADAARFDEAIVDGNRFLAAGDADGASRALSIARAIDPIRPLWPICPRVSWSTLEPPPAPAPTAC